MLVSKWVINKIGLVDFWYYDEEEFCFEDGRMLLRGANGSGKSVTMQSFIPLLLDGNKASERLDPFGTKARKLDNYLLEENDGREERTGYLYMEFKRRESDTYLTIGIGMCAKKNKRLDSWHFVINDGRRIGKDFFLYKDMKYKITLTKKELMNRLGEGGQVIEGQREYMSMVNDRLFGYETVEEYKELVDLLIQLRMPKLSKDFKPTVLNEILSNSLPPLSDDDLRPMSEAIENMDQLKDQLETLKDSKKAAEKIQESYEKYNRSVLLSKARGFVENAKELEFLKEREQKLEQESADAKEELQKQRKLEEERELERETLEKQKEELDKNDVSRLMKQQLILQEQLEKKQQQIAEKENKIEKKENHFKDTEGKQKEQISVKEMKEEEIHKKLEEMEEIFQVLSFDEHSFMESDLEKHLEERYSFDTIQHQVGQLRKNIDKGIEILREEKTESEKYDELQIRQEKEEKKEKDLQREQEALREQEEQVKSEWIEKFYQWNRENTQLVLDEESRQHIVTAVEKYQEGQDFADIREVARKEKQARESKLQTRLLDVQHQQGIAGEKVEELEGQLQEWIDKKDPEPERTKEVHKNREWLEKEGIPFQPFYKVLDFLEKENEQQRDRFEEALLEMGLLDALVVPSNYKDKVLAHRAGQRDSYIFSSGEYLEENLGRIMEITMEHSDIVFYQEISNLLQGIGVAGEGMTRIWEQGFQLGVLHGTITGEYKAKYIGVKAREAFKQKKIEELQELLEQEKQRKEKIDHLVLELQQAKSQLEKEFGAFPREEDVKLAAREWYVCRERLDRQQEELKVIREKVEKQGKKLQEIRLKAVEICRQVYVRKSLEDFLSAQRELGEYEISLLKLKAAHEQYIAILEMLGNLQEQMEEQLADLDDLRYDLGIRKREQRNLESELSSCEEQLKLKDYEAVKEQLAYCVKRLKELPQEIKEASNRQVALEKEQEQRCRDTESIKSKIEIKEKEYALSERGFQDERALGYVEEEIPREITNSVKLAQYLVKVLEHNIGKRTEEYLEELQGRFHQYKSEMTEASLQMKRIFEAEQYLSYGLEEKAGEYHRVDIRGKYKGKDVSFSVLLKGLTEDLEVHRNLVKESDRELFEDILAQTISKKIRAKIYKSEEWVTNMNKLMGSMNTSSGLRLSLRWKKKKAEDEQQLDTGELVELLKKDAGILTESEVDKMSRHFQSKVAEARRRLDEEGNTKSFHGIMKDILDYRNWFEFQLYYQKTGENTKELTNNAFFTFSGGEKAMAMYVPLFSAVVAKYQGAREDAPKLVSLDEAFAGVDENNIRDMFRLMVELNLQFIINSQILWGDCDTVPSLAIYQLLRPENAKYVSVLPYRWNGKVRTLAME